VVRSTNGTCGRADDKRASRAEIETPPEVRWSALSSVSGSTRGKVRGGHAHHRRPSGGLPSTKRHCEAEQVARAEARERAVVARARCCALPALRPRRRRSPRRLALLHHRLDTAAASSPGTKQGQPSPSSCERCGAAPATGGEAADRRWGASSRPPRRRGPELLDHR